MKQGMRLLMLLALLASLLCVGALASDSPGEGENTCYTITSGTKIDITGKSNTAFSVSVTDAGANGQCLLLVVAAPLNGELPSASGILYIDQGQADASGKLTFENVVPKDMSKDTTYYIYAVNANHTLSTVTPAEFAYKYLAFTPGVLSGSGTKPGVNDAVSTLRASVKKVNLNEVQTAAADVNRNGRTDVNDAVLILRRSLDKIQNFD